MTNHNLFEALEICLQSLDQGADVESCLVRFPDLSEELRPILIAAVQARSIAAGPVPVDAVSRGKTRFLQAAAEMREKKKATPVAPVLPFWRKKGFFSARFARLAISSMVMIVFLATGGTGLVNASGTALPGDHLYPVKRGWEGVRLLFVFDEHAKVELENEFEHERVHEIEELYSEKRTAVVDFQGIVQEQNDRLWIINGLNIYIEDETIFTGEIIPGSLVQVLGETDDGHIKAESITLLATPGVTPSAFPSSIMPSPVSSVTPGVTSSETEDAAEPISPTEVSESSEDDSSSSDQTISPTSDDSTREDDKSENDNLTPTPEPHATEFQDSKTPEPTEAH